MSDVFLDFIFIVIRISVTKYVCRIVGYSLSIGDSLINNTA